MTRCFLILVAILFAAQFSIRADASDLIQSTVFENAAYLRVGNVGKNLPREIQSAEDTPAATNKIAGTVLDLRFAGGDDSNSAKSAGDMLGQKKLPLAILVNDETSGAAIELARQLRNADAGLIFGSSTNLSPDVSISMSAEDEKKLIADPWGTISTNQIHLASAATNDFLPFVDHTTEADLVRARIKDGEEDSAMAAKQEPQKPFIRDPVLARGLDFVKGLAIMRQWHS